MRAQLFILDSAREPSELSEFQRRFHVGKPVSGHVLSANREKKLLRIVLHPLFAVADEVFDSEASKDNLNVKYENITAHIREGCIVGGRVSKILPGVGGLIVQICPSMHGRVHFTELNDPWVSDPLSGYHEGQFVKCKVLEISHSAKGTFHIDLSLCSSVDGLLSNQSKESYKDV